MNVKTYKWIMISLFLCCVYYFTVQRICYVIVDLTSAPAPSVITPKPPQAYAI